MNIHRWVAIIVGLVWAVSAAAGAATYFVNIGTNGSDADLNDGICDADLGTGGLQCTLRAAIEQANFNPGPDNIFFNLPTGITPQLPVLTYTSALPNIVESVLLDASTQPIFGRVELSGQFAGAGAKGLVIQANNCVVRNLTVNRFGSTGIVLRLGGGHKIEGCIVGLNSGGTTARANTLDGILIENSSNNIIGGMLAGQGNIISGNSRNGIYIAQTNLQQDLPVNNVIVGNLIGLNAAGTAKIPNAQNGILVEDASFTTIGDAFAAGRNIISGNNLSGVRVTGDPEKTTGTLILSNYIGTNPAGLAPIGNLLHGVFLDGPGLTVIGDATTTPGLAPGNLIAANSTGINMADMTGHARINGNSIGAGIGGAPVMPNSQGGIRALGETEDVIVGGADDYSGNLIAHNGINGVVVAPTARRIAMLRNSIFNNNALGIDLGADGVTANDADDADVGANDRQNFPELIIAGTRAGRLRIDGALFSIPNTEYRVEFFSNQQCDPVGFGEGEAYLGFADVKTTDDGETVFSVYLPQPEVPGLLITATATSPISGTSEFSACEEIVEIDVEGLVFH